jgi:hypothetical protein
MAYHVLILQFVMHHKFGRTQLDNIHDTANLMALCKICHFAYDSDEWTFLPADITTWLQEAKAEIDEAEINAKAEIDEAEINEEAEIDEAEVDEAEVDEETEVEEAEVDEAEVDEETEVDGEAEINGDFIRRRNAQRDIEFRRWRLIYDPDSEASRDGSYTSAFTNEPIKRWLGEAGVAILGIAAISETPTFPGMDEELRNALDTYGELLRIWRNYKRPCSKGDCRICKDGDDEDDKGDDEDDKGDDEDDKGDNDDDENDEDDEGDNGQSDQKKRRMSRRGQQDGSSKPPPKSRQTGQSSTRKLRSGNRSIRTTTPGRSKVSMPRHITRKRNKSSQRKTSALYDKSVPYSHREGYTFAKCTANDMMRMWQMYRE